MPRSNPQGLSSLVAVYSTLGIYLLFASLFYTFDIFFFFLAVYSTFVIYLCLPQSISHFWFILFFCGCVLNTWDLLVFASLFHTFHLFFLFVAVYSSLGICPCTLHFELVIVSRCAFYTFDLVVVCHCLVTCTIWTSSSLSPRLWVWTLQFHMGMITISLSP